MRYLLSSLAIVFLFTGCGKPLPDFGSIDLDQWRKDRNACGTYRAGTQHDIVSQKDKLLALKEMQVVALLGRPDRNELYKRNQKFYYYYLKPSPDCPNYTATENTRLTIRFNATGLAQEILVE